MLWGSTFLAFLTCLVLDVVWIWDRRDRPLLLLEQTRPEGISPHRANRLGGLLVGPSGLPSFGAQTRHACADLGRAYGPACANVRPVARLDTPALGLGGGGHCSGSTVV